MDESYNSGINGGREEVIEIIIVEVVVIVIVVG